MAVGDAVNGISAVGTLVDFQPAASVEVCITSVLVTTLIGATLTDATLTTVDQSLRNDLALGGGVNIKLFVNNTRFLRIAVAASVSTGFSGITTK